MTHELDPQDLTDAAALVRAPESRPSRPQSKRDWDRQHPGTTYRLDPSVPAAIRDVRTWYKEQGHYTTLSQIAEDLLNYALLQWDAGHVEINTRPLRPKARPLRKTPGP